MRALPLIVRDVAVDVDVVGAAAAAMMMQMVAHTSSLLTTIELVRRPLSGDCITPLTTQGVS
jgi:hypothetical protein